MDDKHKQEYLAKYKQAKQKGVKFWPDIIYKDLIIAIALFLILVLLATFVGVANEPKADPSDNTYVPRPEWYFLFLFQMLKYFPGVLEFVGTTIIPGLAVLALFLLPFYDQNPFRHWKKRILAISIMSVIVLGMVALTILAVVSTPKQAEAGTLAVTLPEKIAAGSDLYSVQCVECHGADGEGGEVKGVVGMEGRILEAINSKDVMYTRTDETLQNVISYGQPDLGMPGFGKAYGGELSIADIEAIVDFMRYTWDDRAEMPKEAQGGAIPSLAAGEVPSYEKFIQPIAKKYCVSCHRSGKTNNNYLMGSYDELMKTGDHAPNVIPGDLNSNMIRMLHREEIEAGGPMPPSKELKPELIQIFELWVKAGAPNTIGDAQLLTAPQVTETVVTLTPTITATLGTPQATITPVPTTGQTIIPTATPPPPKLSATQVPITPTSPQATPAPSDTPPLATPTSTPSPTSTAEGGVPYPAPTTSP
jgi:quinol---cytochrome c reductase cytochrome c subunit, bacillus type